MSDPLYPDVPALPGVPPVFRGPNNAAGASATPPPALTQDSVGALTAERNDWGIFTIQGQLALAVDSIFSIEPSREFRVSDYPVEQGGFQSYNKVATPQDTRVSVTKGGSDADRADFFAALDVLCASYDLFNIVTPDNAYTDVNLVRYDYRRTSEDGATLVLVNIEFIEIRQSVQSKFTDSKAPSGADLKNDGPVQTQAPTTAQTPPAGIVIA